MQQPQSAAAGGTSAPQDSGKESEEAPPKQVALAMDRLTRAARLVADVRLGADHLLEAMFAVDDPYKTSKIVQLMLKQGKSMRQHFDDLRALGRQLEDSGVLNGSLKSRGNSWGLHMPLVCPDGAVVAYAWKRQLAGQAGASAVDRTRLALKAFTDQKRRFFPHLEDNSFAQAFDSEHRVAKKHNSQRLNMGPINGLGEEKTLSDILNNLEHEESNVRIFRYQRLDWLRRASSLSSTPNENLMDPSKEQGRNMSNLRAGSTNVTDIDKVAVIELLAPSVFRAVVSLHPAGSVNPDAVAFFSPDEEGNYIHASGFSVHHVFRHVTEYSDKALQYFLSMDKNISLYLLLRWICSYQTLTTKVCSKCGRLLRMDKSSAILLPPVHRPYKGIPSQLPQSAKGQSPEPTTSAYHIGCSIDEV